MLLANTLGIVMNTDPTSTNKISEIIEPPKDDKDPEEIRIEQDFNLARSNMLNSLEIAKQATEYMFQIAKEREDFKSFDSLNNLLKNVVDSSRQLVDLYNRKQEYKDRRSKGMTKEEANAGTTSVTIENAVFTGTLQELKNHIKNMKKEP